jgi:hypothetical protein
MRNMAGTQLWRLTPDPTPHSLQDQDMIALATISTAVGEWIQGEQLPPPLYKELKEHLARYKIVNRSDTVGEVFTTIYDLTRRLHDAFSRNGETFSPSPRATTYVLHLPTGQQANAAAATVTDNAIDITVARENVSRPLPWRLVVTLPGVAPDPVHAQNEEDLTSLAQKHGGAYAGCQRPSDQTQAMQV